MPADLHKSIEDLKERIRNRGQTFQPLVVAVGPLYDIKAYYIVINDEMYKTSKVIQALGLALKLFFVLDCKYPETSNTLWLFVQKCICDIHLDQDLKNASLNILIGHINEKLKT